MLRRVVNETIPATLAVKGQGESWQFDLTYHNRKQSQVEALMAEAGKAEKVVDLVLFLVKEWDADYPLTAEGVKDMEDDRPGMILAIIQGFHDARQVARAKN